MLYCCTLCSPPAPDFKADERGLWLLKLCIDPDKPRLQCLQYLAKNGSYIVFPSRCWDSRSTDSEGQKAGGLQAVWR